MNINVKISSNNYLAFQLYIASKSQQITKKRKRTRLIVPILYSIFAISLFIIGNAFLAAGFAAFALLWFFFYPIWERKKYEKYFQTVIQENYKNRIDADIKINIENDFIYTSSGGSEAKTSIKEIKEIVELKDIILIKMDVTLAFVIPKDQVKDVTSLIAELKEVAKKVNVEYKEELDWKW